MNEASTPNFNLGHKVKKEDVDLYSWADEEREKSPRQNDRNSHNRFELDVKPLISSSRWLQLHGLKRNRLKLHQILSRIGFKHTDSYIKSLKKPVGSYYGEGLFKQMRTNGGKTYNITVGKETLHEIENNLTQSLRLIKRRQEWLTSGSRKIFGVIQEHCICIVLDVSTMVQSQFDMYREAVCEVLQDQVTQLAKFNLIRAQSDILMWQDAASPVSDVTIKNSMDWVKGLDRMAEISNTSCTEAVIKACEDDTLEAVYLFTEGDVSESSKELLRQKLKESPIPLHTISFNATKASTVTFLKSLSAETGGRFHAFVVKSEYEDDDDILHKTSGYPLNGTTANIMSSMRLSQKSRGGLPHGAGVREDVFLIWNEQEEARNILADIQALISNIEEECEQRVDSQALVPVLTKRQEANLSSKDWLRLHGLEANRLTIFHALASFAFKHIDDVIELQGKPTNTMGNDAHQILKLIEAKYCKNFPHIVWKDNQVVHVYVSAELFRSYERKMKTLLSTFQQRIDWLQQGSREVFGSILEERIYFVIDTSHSMGENLPVLKEKLMQLFQEQLRHKSEFNLVKFETKASSWKPRLEEVTEDSLQKAWHWVRNLEPGGSTNTLAALRIALSDPNTEGIYLLTDGRPDQPLHCVLSQIQLRKPVPIHTISFNCNDAEANQFLHQLALDTGGRYHCYTTHGGLPHGPIPFESEDVSLLKSELQRGRDDLQRMSDLRAKCVMLDWYYNRKTKKDSPSNDKRVALRMPSPPPSAPCCLAQKKAKSLPPSSPKYEDTAVPGRPSTALGITTQPTLLEISHKHHRGQFGVNDEEMFSTEIKQITNGDISHRTNSSDQIRTNDNKRKSRKKKIREVPNTVWLKTNGLMAKKMTIMDALGPTVIRQRRKYIPILNKHVLSKVFDDVLPIAHVSPRSKKEIRLVNPNAVHLEVYERELQKLLESYRNRLNGQIWNHLSKVEKDKYGSKDTFYYVRDPEYESETVKDEVDVILEEKGWPIPKHQIQVLLDEIHLGEKYLQQSIDLQTAVIETSTEQKKKPKSPQDLNTPTKRPGRKRRPRNPRKAAVPVAVSTESSSTSDNEGSVSTSQSSNNQTNDDHEDDETETEPVSEDHNEKDPYNVKDILKYLSGEIVVARSEFDGFYYDGTLMQCLDMRYAHIRFNHGEDQITSTRYILPLSQELPQPSLRLGDYVLAKTRTSTKEPVHYVPGIVVGLPEKRKLFSNHYKILLCDNSKKRALRQTIIKIDETRYKLAVQFIKARLERLGCDLERESISDDDDSCSQVSVVSNTQQFTEVKEKIKILQEMLKKQTTEIERLRKKEKSSPKPIPTPVKEIIHVEDRMTSPIPQQDASVRDIGVQSEPEVVKKVKEPVQEPIQVSLDKENQAVTITNGDTGVVLSRHHPNDFRAPLEIGQEVLAKFDDDGWYYRGTIKNIYGNGQYDVTDANNSISRVSRDNVILDEEDAKNKITAHHRIVALHPSYLHSYAPAIVLTVENLKYYVKFYDDSESVLPREEVYLITNLKYEDNIAYIDQCEQRWEGQAVVARNDADGLYHLAFCKRRIGRTRRFTLQWSDGTTSEQYLAHMFGALSRKHDFETGDHILAIPDLQNATYLPGFVTGISDMGLTVNFCNGSCSHEIPPTLSYYLAKEYYEQAVEYYDRLR
uniref:von Willebrand factor A domain-containing protein 3B-like isoform X1 n=1 Tax=Styela clava TaxID=7725 RepID=UPI001939EE2A|nr:von Willebrand factor A domain-containing protein 3B-like isoform X1 [Styela clava]